MRLWIRAEASPALGWGHVMRTIAVAEAHRRGGGEARFVMGDPADGPRLARRRGIPVDLIEGSEDRTWMASLQAGDAVLFDGYAFGPPDFAPARAHGARVGVIDDLGEGEFPVDVLLNQNSVTSPSYVMLPETQVLLGPAFAQVRSEFVARRRLRSGAAGVLLCTFGASVHARAAIDAASAVLVHDQPFSEIVVVGAPVPPALRGAGVVTTVGDPDDVAAVFDRADAAFAAAGSTTWELLCMGIPAVLVQTVPNQRHVGGPVAEAGAGIFIGGVADIPSRLPESLRAVADPQRQAAMSAAALGMVDGRGADRLLAALTR